MKNPQYLGMKMWVGGEFKLLKSNNYLDYIIQGIDLSKFPLEKEEVVIIDDDKFMTRNGDIFLLESKVIMEGKKH